MDLDVIDGLDVLGGLGSLDVLTVVQYQEEREREEISEKGASIDRARLWWLPSAFRRRQAVDPDRQEKTGRTERQLKPDSGALSP